MGKSTAYYEKKCLALLSSNAEITCIEDICAFGGFMSKKTFYTHKLHECDAIKEALEKNRRGNFREAYSDLRAQSREGNSTATIALLKLNGTDEERERLSNKSDIRADIRADVKAEVAMGFDPLEAVRELYGKEGGDE